MKIKNGENSREVLYLLPLMTRRLLPFSQSNIEASFNNGETEHFNKQAEEEHIKLN